MTRGELVRALVAASALALSARITAQADAQTPLLRTATGYFSPNDGFEHAIVGTSQGRLNEIFFDPQRGIFNDEFGCFHDVVSIAGFYTDDDSEQHVIVARTDGSISDVQFGGGHPIRAVTLAQIPGIVDIAGFYSPDDNMRHVIVATTDGAITEIFYDPSFAQGQALLATIPGVISVAGFFSSDDNYRHAIVASSGGDVTEIFFHPSVGIGQTVLGTFSGIVDIAGFFTPDDNDRHVIVASADGSVTEIYFNPQQGIGQAPLINLPAIVAVGGYFTPTDNNRHAIVALSDGTVHEVYYNPTVGIAQADLGSFAPVTPSTEDISPNVGFLNQDSSAGLMIGVVGDDSLLYAVSPNAGIWRSVARDPWVQLPNSPQYAYSISIDPDDSSHLAVGERNGDAVDPAREMVGAWESNDAGDTWNYVLDPASLGCGSRAVPAVAISHQSTLFVATPCGLVAPARGPSPIGLPSSGGGPRYNSGDRSIRALVASSREIWARTFDTLLISSDDGISWTAVPIPEQCDATNGCEVDGPDFVGITSAAVSLGRDRGDDRSLAAFDGLAILSVGSSLPSPGNCDLLVYRQVRPDPLQPWSLQRVYDERVGGHAPIGSGIGLGGRRFLRAFELNRPELAPIIGERFRLIYGAGQDIESGVGIDSNGLIQWNSFVVTTGSGPPPVPPTNPLLTNFVHADVWGANVSLDGVGPVWIAGDGGIFENQLSGAGWVARVDGLHTHHVHTLNVLPLHVARSPIIYPTADNDAWDADELGVWRTPGLLGDANWTAADPGNPRIALGARRPAGFGLLTDFGAAALPPGAQFNEGNRITLNTDETFDGPLFLQFLATEPSELAAYPLLDAVMLAVLPLRFYDASNTLVPVPGVLGQANSGGAVLIRNNQFAANPDLNLLYRGSYPSGQAWQLEANDLPSGTQGFWASGGHVQPTYYAYARETNGFGLYRKSPGSGWVRLGVNGLLAGSTYGPAFVNPWDPNQIYVLTESGVQVSADGGASFAADLVLTNLITGQGKFPLTPSYTAADETDIDQGAGAHATLMGTLSHMAFDHDRPHAVVAASPFTGVFYNSGDGVWRNLSGYLPTPHTPVSAVGLDCEAVYVATEGRSIVRINGGDTVMGAALCAGDCDGNGAVSIDELVRAVNIALGTLQLAECGALDSNSDGQVTINELITAVAHALDGC